MVKSVCVLDASIVEIARAADLGPRATADYDSDAHAAKLAGRGETDREGRYGGVHGRVYRTVDREPAAYVT